MKITVNYLAQIKQAAGISSESVYLDTPCSLKELVTQLAEKHGEPLRSFLFDPAGGLRTSILIIIDETQVHWETPVQIQEGDVISLLSPLAGG